MNNRKQKLLFTIHYTPFTDKAFTLAEVLITLGIIGVVAAITIPILMNNIQDTQLKEALKKEVSVISQATSKIASDNGSTLVGLFVTSPLGLNVDKFTNYLSSVKVCHSDIDINGCWHSSGKWYKYPATAFSLNSGFYSTNGGLVLKDGTLVLISETAATSCTGGAYMAWEGSGTSVATWVNGNPLDCIIVFVDVNGFKPPNTTGKDIFALSLREPGIVYPGVFTALSSGVGCAGAVMRGETCP